MPYPAPDGVVFDCDATLSALEGIDELAAQAGVAAEVSTLTHRAMNGDIPLEAIYGERLALIRPPRASLAAIARRYQESIVPGAREIIAALQARGIKTAIVSGGLLDAVLPLAAAVGVAAADTFAVSLQFDDAGNYLHYLDNPLTITQRSMLLHRYNHLRNMCAEQLVMLYFSIDILFQLRLFTANGTQYIPLITCF